MDHLRRQQTLASRAWVARRQLAEERVRREALKAHRDAITQYSSKETMARWVHRAYILSLWFFALYGILADQGRRYQLKYGSFPAWGYFFILVWLLVEVRADAFKDNPHFYGLLWRRACWPQMRESGSLRRY